MYPIFLGRKFAPGRLGARGLHPVDLGPEVCARLSWAGSLHPVDLGQKFVPDYPGPEVCARSTWARSLNPIILGRKFAPYYPRSEVCTRGAQTSDPPCISGMAAGHPLRWYGLRAQICAGLQRSQQSVPLIRCSITQMSLFRHSSVDVLSPSCHFAAASTSLFCHLSN